MRLPPCSRKSVSFALPHIWLDRVRVTTATEILPTLRFISEYAKANREAFERLVMDTTSTQQAQQTEDGVSLSFTEVEKVIGKPLCKSTFKFYSYWYPGYNRPISNVIYNAGFDVDRVDLKNILDKILSVSAGMVGRSGM